MHRAVAQREAGRTAEEMSRELGVSKAKFGGLQLNEGKRLKDLEDENGRLKRLIADLSLDREALKWLIEKMYVLSVYRKHEMKSVRSA